MKVSVLMACHNRRDKTLRCLESVVSQECEAELTVFLVDDASTDGTADAVRRRFPEVQLIAGTGNLYWAGGTRKAYEAAARGDFDYVLWLNDDVELESNAIARLLGAYVKVAEGSDGLVIIVGALRDPYSPATTYSGAIRKSRLRRMHFSLIQPTDRVRRCETMNGNLVLIPREVCHLLGNIDDVYVHTMGDFDYGLRATKAGCVIWLCEGHLGTCSRNDPRGTYADESLPLKQRLRSMRTIKNMYGPSRLEFVKRHGGRLWLVYWLSPYVNVVITALLRNVLIRVSRFRR